MGELELKMLSVGYWSDRWAVAGRHAIALGLVVTLAACSAELPISRAANPPPMSLAEATIAPENVAAWAPLLSSAMDPVKPTGRTGVMKVGKPYLVAGHWYYPQHQPTYDKVGIASWYGLDFHGHRTANGEVYDMNGLSAAHPTLPLPSIVSVTNLENGRTILVRVNDRGPYARDRIIDMSREAANLLGYNGHGTAKVRVRYVGQAPLDGNDSKERAYLAQQDWYQPKYASLVRKPIVKQKIIAAAWTADTDAVVDPAPPRIPAGHSFKVRLGAFRSQDNAIRMAQRMKSVGPVAIEPDIAVNGTVYVVTVGPFMDGGGANQKLAEIAGLGVPDAVVEQD